MAPPPPDTPSSYELVSRSLSPNRRSAANAASNSVGRRNTHPIVAAAKATATNPAVSGSGAPSVGNRRVHTSHRHPVHPAHIRPATA